MKRVLAALLLPAALAQAAWVPDPALFAYAQHPGARLPLAAQWREADGRELTLGELGGAPLIVVLGYFHCPNLCGVVRESLFRALSGAALTPAHDYRLAVISIDPTEGSVDALTAKTRELTEFGAPGAERGWYYLTGSAAAISELATAVGFQNKLDAQTKQYVHPAGVVIARADGVISSYLLGVGYAPSELRAAVERAAAGRLAAAASPVLLLCFHFDPGSGRYTLEIMKLLRLAAVLTALTVGGVLWLLFKRERA